MSIRAQTIATAADLAAAEAAADRAEAARDVTIENAESVIATATAIAVLPGAEGMVYVTDPDGNIIIAKEPGDDPPSGSFWDPLVANAKAGADVAALSGTAVLPGGEGRSYITDSQGNVTWEGDSWDPAASGGGGGSTTTDLPLATDSSTLQRLRALLGAKLRNGTGIIRVGMIGDSWVDNGVIAGELKAFLTAAYGASGYGWITCDGLGDLTGLTHTQSGWTLFDASDLGGSPIATPDPSIGSAIDGKAISTTGTTAVSSITVQCETFKIFYRDGNGTFRYRLDGGTWTAVTGAGTGNPLTVTLSSLADASHTIDIDTTGNAGTAVIYGYRAIRTAPGIELHKMGNGGIEGEQWLPILSYQPYYWTELAPDLLIIILGTNDYRSSRYNLMANFTAALTGLAEGARAVVPDMGVILWAPADTNGSPQLPLTEFVEEMHRLSGADELDCEFFNHNKLFGTWAESNALGLMQNNLHPSALGGFVSSKEVFRTFFWGV